MKMEKKRLAIVYIAICLIMTTAVPVYANYPEEGFVPLSEYYYSAKATLAISPNGTATVTGKISGLTGVTTKTTVHLYLQKKESGNWIDVDDWVLSNDTSDTTLQRTKSVAKGYTYRAKASCYAYCGKDYERTIKYSDEIKY